MMGPFLLMIGIILLIIAEQGKSQKLLEALGVPLPTVSMGLSNIITVFVQAIFKALPFKIF